MHALPIITPSIVSVARTLFARSACRARCQVSFQNTGLRGVAVIACLGFGFLWFQSEAPVGFALEECGLRHRRAALTRAGAIVRALRFDPGPTAARRGTVRPPRRDCLATHKAALAIRGPTHGAANRFDPAWWRERISGRPPLRPDRNLKAREPRRDSSPGGDHWRSPAPQPLWRARSRLLRRETGKNT